MIACAFCGIGGSVFMFWMILVLAFIGGFTLTAGRVVYGMLKKLVGV